MTWLHRLASVLGWLVHRNRAEQKLDDELHAFLEISAAEKVRGGLPPEHAAGWRFSSSVASSRPGNASVRIATARGSTRSDETCGMPSA